MESETMKGTRTRPATFSPCWQGGAVSVEELAQMVAAMRDSGAKTAKLTGEIVFVWEGAELPQAVRENGRWQANNFKAARVRPVRTCSAEVFCQRFRQPVVALGKEIDARFKDIELPRKLMIGVAGCQRSCSEPSTKDIGLIGHPEGYEILAGGSAGLHPMIGQSLGIVRTMDDALAVIGRIIGFVRGRDKKARLGKTVRSAGTEEFKKLAGIDGLFIRKDKPHGNTDNPEHDD